MELALAADKSIKAAESDVVKANEGRRQAHRSRGVTFKIEHDTVRLKNQVNDIYTNSFQNAISGTYPIYTGGLIEGSISASEHELRSQILTLERVRQEVRFSVASAFFTILRTEDMAKLARDAVERLEAHVHNVDVQYKNGKVSKSDLLRSEVELINARQSMSQADKEYSVAVKNLNNLMGLPLGAEFFHEEKMVYTPFPSTLDECLEYALSSHPNIAIADAQEKKAKAGIMVEESARKPQVTLVTTQTLSSLHNWPGTAQDNLQAVVHAEFTFSDAGVTASKIRSAREDLKKAGYNYEAAKERIVLDVTNNYMTMEEAKIRITTGEVALGKAQEAYRISLVRYREGIGTNLDVLDAQTSLNQASSNQTQALCDYNIAAAQVEYAAGYPVSSGTAGVSGTNR